MEMIEKKWSLWIEKMKEYDDLVAMMVDCINYFIIWLFFKIFGTYFFLYNIFLSNTNNLLNGFKYC